MLIIVSVALIILSIATIRQTNKLNKVTDALRASDSVVMEAERIIRQQRVEDEVLYNPVLRGVITKFYGQADKGLHKYGNTVNPDEYTEEEWLLHFQQEMIDGAVYVETILHKKRSGGE